MHSILYVELLIALNQSKKNEVLKQGSRCFTYIFVGGKVWSGGYGVRISGLIYTMSARTLLLNLLLGVLAVAVTYSAPSQILHTNTDTFKGTPGQLLYKDAIQVVDDIQEFLPTLNEFEKMKFEEGDRDLEIRSYGLQRNKKSGGFKTQSWRRKRSTMEEELISAAYLENLDKKAEEMISSIHIFLNDLQKVRQFYEGRSRGRGMRSSTTVELEGKVPQLTD